MIFLSTLQASSLRSKRFSSGFMVQSDMPYLMSLNDDPLSCEIMIYNIKPGETTLGNDKGTADIGKRSVLGFGVLMGMRVFYRLFKNSALR